VVYSKKKSYIAQFVGQGMTFENACKIVYADQKEKDQMLADTKFITQLEEIHNTLLVEKLEAYNNKVLISDKPNDNLKQLAYLAPEVFDREIGNDNMLPDSQVKPFIINIGDGVIKASS